MSPVQNRRGNRTTTKPFRTILAALVAAAVAALALAQAGVADPAIIEREATGAGSFEIDGAVSEFREDLGGTNNGVGNTFPDGRREINWDGVPDSLAAPNDMPPDLFRARGAIFSTPGTGFQVSADLSNPTNTVVRFGNLAGEFPSEFEAFSPERLFAAPDSTATEVRFFVPGTAIPATVDGFGAVFTDVDRADSSSIEYLGTDGTVLFEQRVPATPGDETFSFTGATFDTARLARVRITSGEKPLEEFAGGNEDFVAMDDFVFGEPQTRPTVAPLTPAPGSQIRASSPTVRARITDAQTDLAKSDIRLFVDGEQKNFAYDRGTDVLSSAQRNLGGGRHLVRIVARDESGLTKTRTWNFRVIGA